MKKYILSAFLLFPIFLTAQIGGSNVYGFIDLPVSARVTAIGGNAIPVWDDDVALAFQNPAVLHEEMHNHMTFNTTLYFAGINFGYFGYGRHNEKLSTTFAAGLQYITYGKFTETDPMGNQLGEFTAGEYALNLAAARRYKKFSYGGQLKLIYSAFDDYSSYGLALDAGGMYIDTANRFTAALVVKNMGAQLKPYTPGNREPLPFEIQVGITKQLEHLPFRLSVVAHNLQQPDIRYNDPNIAPPTNLFDNDTVEVREKKYIVDKIAYHFIIGGEFFLGNNLRLRGGYNHMRRQNLSIETRRGMSGFSLGAGIRISKFRLDYGLTNYHVAGSSHTFSVSTNLAEFIPSVGQ